MGIFEKKISFNVVPLHKVRRWISLKTEQILGKEDEIFIDYCINQLVYKIRKSPAEEELQISPNEFIKNIEGFLGEKAIEFVSELWQYILKFVENKENPKIKSNKSYNSIRSVNIKNNILRSADVFNKDSNHLTTKKSNNKKVACNRIYKGNVSYMSIRSNTEESSRLTPIISRHSKENKRTRSLSRSLSPGFYESHGIKNYKNEKTIKMGENSIIDEINHSKGCISKSEKKSERLSNTSKHVACRVETTFSSNINLLDNQQVGSQVLNTDKMEEHHLRMKALEQFKRKNQVKNCRSESEEILRARVIEKFIKKKPTN
ncbi:PWI domain containing that is typically seen in spliceosomal [Cryptosporidium sp. chipmunk genotype I]|uniref:PWI domain containing that is typically seen in spliceosomal n=1 Tax=Cryptosporidium sp. chipmunk genotype I TaxID=1280935 RepID=UPI00351A272C|nr:PWI domain containing that is typically seen in spliceosomal [Cryptosporidium sp. chipmunk genotype I]